MKTEQGLLRISIVVTFLLAGVGILFGILSGFFAIVFDGVYALTDAAMTIVALLVSNLIATGGKGRLVNISPWASGISNRWCSALTASS